MDRTINCIEGVIRSQSVGLARAGVRIKIMERTELRVRWPLEQRRYFVAGQCVLATIPAGAVRLEAGMFRRTNQRWNRWTGRIALVEHRESGPLYTVKIHREDWTIKAYGPVLGARQPIQTWDVVSIVVDPQLIQLSPAGTRAEQFGTTRALNSQMNTDTERMCP
jgi:hypothetical protein